LCQPEAGQVVVRFTYGSEKEAWIHEVTGAFSTQGVKTASGKRICVHAIPKGPGDSVNEIKHGQAGPDEVHATSPASDLYVNLINHEFDQEQGTDLLKVEGFLVSSPVVIAVWEPVLAQLGPPDRIGDQIGWGSIFEHAQDPSFRYGQTNPKRSNSGLSALVAQFYAGAEATTGKPIPRLSKTRVENPQVRAFVAKVHESIIHYGASTGFYAKKMRDGGPSYADAVVIYESDVIQANTAIAEQGSGFPRLVAIYPKEGTFATNHPFAVVKRDWVDADEEDGAKRYFEYLMSPRIQAQALQYGFRPGVALDLDRKIYEGVWNASKGVQPFDTVHKFLAAPGGAVAKEIRDAFRAIKKKSLVYLIIDRSGSMDAKVFDQERNRKRTRIELAVESANLLSEHLQDKDRLSLVLYDYQVDYAELTPTRGGALSNLPIDIPPRFQEFGGFRFHSFRYSGLYVLDLVRRGKVAYVLGDLHGAEVRAAHGTKVGDPVRLVGHGPIVVLAGTFRVEGQVELVFPTELEACLREGVVPYLGTGEALGQIGAVGGDLVGDDTVTHIVPVG